MWKVPALETEKVLNTLPKQHRLLHANTNLNYANRNEKAFQEHLSLTLTVPRLLFLPFLNIDSKATFQLIDVGEISVVMGKKRLTPPFSAVVFPEEVLLLTISLCSLSLSLFAMYFDDIICCYMLLF